MKITAERNELVNACTYASKAIGKRVPVPVLAGMRLDVAGETLTVSAFDYDVACIARVDGTGADSGTVLVTGAQLVTALKSMPKGTKTRPEYVTITGTYPDAELPELPELPTGEHHSIGMAPYGDSPGMLRAVCSCKWESDVTYGTAGAQREHERHLDREAPALVQAMRARERAAELARIPTVVIECAGLSQTVTGLDASEYPQLPEVPAEWSGTVPGEDFAQAVTRVARSAGIDDTLPALLCLCLDATADTLTLAATDRYRLAVEDIPWSGPEDGRRVLVPAKLAAEYVKAAAHAGKVTVHASEFDKYGAGFVALSDGTFTMITRQASGDFPRYPALIENHKPAELVTVDANALRAAVERAGKATRESCELVIGETSITVHAIRDSAQATTETVTCESTGTATVRYNPGYLASVLAGIDGKADVSIESPAKPALITDPYSAYRALIMPVRLPA